MGKSILLFGVAILATGFIGYAILCGAAVVTTYTSGSLYYRDIWDLFGVTPIATGFFALGGIGMVVSLIGVWIDTKYGE